jgi:hypothetical protein
MNERIQELIKQATRILPSDWNVPYNMEEFDKEKFAELIVGECVNVSLKSSHRYDDMGAIIARSIEDHFGVEE